MENKQFNITIKINYTEVTGESERDTTYTDIQQGNSIQKIAEYYLEEYDITDLTIHYDVSVRPTHQNAITITGYLNYGWSPIITIEIKEVKINMETKPIIYTGEKLITINPITKPNLGIQFQDNWYNTITELENILEPDTTYNLQYITDYDSDTQQTEKYYIIKEVK